MKKLIPQATNGQRDSRWASTILGNNTDSQYNIGEYGCLITSLGNYVGKTPIEVNTILKNGGGFSAGDGDFIWTKCLLLGLTETATSSTFTDAMPDSELTVLKGYIDKGLPCLCEIDFYPSTVSVESHYVLLIGYDGSVFYAFDPWTGAETDFSTYGGIQRAMIKYHVYDKTLPFTSSTSTTTSSSSNMTSADINANKATQVDQSLTFLKNQGYITSDDSTQYYDGKFTTLIEKLYNDYKSNSSRAYIFDNICLLLGYTDSTTVTLDDITAKIKGLMGSQATIDNLNSQLTTLTTQVATLQATNSTQFAQLNECKIQSDIYKVEYDNVNSPNGYKAQIASLESDKKTWIDKEENYQQQIKTLQTKLNNIKSPIKQLLIKILEQIQLLTKK